MYQRPCIGHIVIVTMSGWHRSYVRIDLHSPVNKKVSLYEHHRNVNINT